MSPILLPMIYRPIRSEMNYCVEDFVYLSADTDTTNTYLLMSLKQVQHASNGCINIQITAHAIAIGQAMARTIIQNKA